MICFLDKYSLMEEMLKHYEGARKVFERWMKWNPDAKVSSTLENEFCSILIGSFRRGSRILN